MFVCPNKKVIITKLAYSLLQHLLIDYYIVSAYSLMRAISLNKSFKLLTFNSTVPLLSQEYNSLVLLFII